MDEPLTAETIEYRPNRSTAWFIAAVFMVTALVLAWLGTILQSSDRTAMDGWTLLLFTAVPIRWFAWGCAAVFVVLGVRVLNRVRRAEPTLSISPSGLSLAGGKPVPWNGIQAVGVTKNDLVFIEWDDGSPRDLLSSFDLGADPAAVALELEGRRTDDSSRGAEPAGER